MGRPPNPNKRKTVSYFTKLDADHYKEERNISSSLGTPMNQLMLRSAKLYGNKLLARAKKDGLV